MSRTYTAGIVIDFSITLDEDDIQDQQKEYDEILKKIQALPYCHILSCDELKELE